MTDKIHIVGSALGPMFYFLNWYNALQYLTWLQRDRKDQLQALGIDPEGLSITTVPLHDVVSPEHMAEVNSVVWAENEKELEEYGRVRQQQSHHQVYTWSDKA